MQLEACVRVSQKFLGSRRKGFRCIVTTPGSEPQDVAAALFEACRPTTEMPDNHGFAASWNSLRLGLGADGALEVLDSDDGEGFPLDLPRYVAPENLAGCLRTLGPAPAIYLTQVQNWDFDALADLLSMVRGIFSEGVDVRTFICGSFGPRALERFWQEKKSYFSPPMDDKAYWLGGVSREKVLDLLRRSLNAVPEEHLEILAFLVESHTSLDRRFFDYLSHELAECPLMAGADGMAMVERLVYGLAEKGSLQDQVWETASSLSHEARKTLEAVLRHQFLCLDEKNLTCEGLAIRGLLAPPEGGPGKHIWRPASPVVATILRQQWCKRFKETPRFPPEDELVPLVLPVAAPAQALVTRIENILRNLLLLAWSPFDEAHPLQMAPKVEGNSLFAETSLAKDMDATDIGSRLYSRQLTSFLTTGHLKAVMENGDCYLEYFSQTFPDRIKLADRFATFMNIRNAVAHNKVLSIRALADLQSLLEFFEGHLGIAAAESLKEDACAEVTKGTIRLQPSRKDGVFKVIGELNGGSRKLVVDIQGQAKDVEGRPIIAPFIQRVVLKPKERTIAEFTLPPGPPDPINGTEDVKILRARPII